LEITIVKTLTPKKATSYSMITIRPATQADFDTLPVIEMDAGQELAKFGLQSVADMPASPPEYYKQLPGLSVVFLACTGEQVVGFVICLVVDGQAHLKELSVMRCHMKKGIGRRLVATSIEWAKAKNFQWLTLTTYRDIPFNAPFYLSLGFTSFETGETWPCLSSIRENEKKTGLDIKARVCMRLSLS